MTVFVPLFNLIQSVSNYFPMSYELYMALTREQCGIFLVRVE